MSNRDSLDADLDRWQDEQDEDRIDPADAERERAEYLVVCSSVRDSRRTQTAKRGNPMTTKQDLLNTLEDIEVDIIGALKRPTIIQRLKFFLAQKTVSSWIAELARIKAARDTKVKQLQTRRKNINKALNIWLDAGDVIGKYETEEENDER